MAGSIPLGAREGDQDEQIGKIEKEEARFRRNVSQHPDLRQGKPSLPTVVHVENIGVDSAASHDSFRQQNLATTERLHAASIRFLYSFLLHVCVGGMLSR